jgi:hypothetical protein
MADPQLVTVCAWARDPEIGPGQVRTGHWEPSLRLVLAGAW